MQVLIKSLEEKGNAEGDIAVINAGVPLGVSGNTNMIKVVTVE